MDGGAAPEIARPARGAPIAERVDWRTVVVAATGPSFDAAQAAELEALRCAGACRVIAVNDNYRRLPHADALYACDKKWWDVHAEAVRAGFPGERWTQDRDSAQRYGLSHIASWPRPGLTRERDLLHGGGNSGYQAINLAYLFGARLILLVGFDMQKTGGLSHWFGRHPAPLTNTHPFSTWIASFAALGADLEAAGVATINCTKETALACFPRADLNATLRTAP